MSKTPFPLYVGDVSAFARSVRRGLDGLGRVPSHVEMLNLLSRAGGYRNFQHLRAQSAARAALDAPAPQPAQVDYRLVREVLRLFDEQGRLVRWPGKFSRRMVCLWALWARIPARRTLTERQVGELLGGAHLFGDHALLRRELVDRGLMERTPDGRQYRRLETPPPPEAAELLRRLRSRR